MHPALHVAFQAAKQAGEVLIRRQRRLDSLQVREKAAKDYVTQADLDSERILISAIRERFPSHGIISEEAGSLEPLGTRPTWIIDPLDGTLNFLHGHPHFSIAMALRDRGHLEAGLVYDPWRQELFTAVRGRGAQCQGRRIRVSAALRWDDAVLSLSLSVRKAPALRALAPHLMSWLERVAGVRSTGSSALDLAYVGAGRVDALFQMGLMPWDLAAGALLVQEAGGIATSHEPGRELMSSWPQMEAEGIVAANATLHTAMQEHIAQWFKAT